MAATLPTLRLERVIYPNDNSDYSQGAVILCVAKGCSIYIERDNAAHWYEVVDGLVRTCRYTADGERRLTGFFYPGEVFGLEEHTYRECAEAVTEVIVRQFVRTTLGGPDNPLQRGFDEAQRRILLLSRKSAAERVAAFLVEAAGRGERTAGVDLPMPRADIADHLGLSMHTVSRTISGFARRGLIAFDGPQHLIRTQVQRLRAIAGEAPERDRR